MLHFSPEFPKRKYLIGYLRVLKARHDYFDNVTFGRITPVKVGQIAILFNYGFKIKPGYQSRLASFYSKYKNKPCFVIGNGSSLKKMDMGFLKDKTTLGCNAVYKNFEKWGFHTTFLFFEDIEQTELRGPDIHKIKGPIKMASIYNAHAFKSDGDTIFFNGARAKGNSYYWNEEFPQFSKDFSTIVHLGGNIIYIMLQWAYHLGCNPVYILGVDFNYGKLPELFPPGKIKITTDNIHLIQGLHYRNDYYKVGDEIGVPDFKMQIRSHTYAREQFEKAGRNIYNIGIDSKLEVYEKIPHTEIFS